MIDYDKLSFDRSYRAGVKETIAHINKYNNLEELNSLLSRVNDLEEQIQKKKMASRQKESEDMEGTPVSC